MAEPYITKSPNDVLRSADWNDIQRMAREEIQTHGHSGPQPDGSHDGAPIERAGIADGAIDGTKIDSSSDVEVSTLSVSRAVTGPLRLRGTGSQSYELRVTGAGLEIGPENKVASITIRPDGDVKVNTDNVELSGENLGFVPLGSIIALYLGRRGLSETEEILAIRAEGFATCDGTDAAAQNIPNAKITGPTPNLNGERRFLRGGPTAGVLEDHLFAAHSHPLGPAGDHTHSFSTGAAGGHDHNFGFAMRDDTVCTRFGGEGGAPVRVRHVIGANEQDAGGGYQKRGGTTVSGAGAHTHSGSTAANGGHNHSVSTQGGSETRPINMSVVWIMRVR